MNELILKSLEIIETPFLIYNLQKKKIIYHNSRAEKLIKELERRDIFSNLSSYMDREIIVTLDDPLIKIYLGKPKRIDEENICIYFDELKKDKPFSGFLFAIFENLPVLVFLIKDGKIFYVNKTIESTLGYQREKILYKNFLKDLVWELDKPKAELSFKRIFENKKEEGIVFALEDKFGRVKNFQWNFFLTKDWDGEQVIASIASDITEYLELSYKIEKLHKTQTFVEFLRGLVHDFNNLLQSILNYLNKLKTSSLSEMEHILYCIEKSIYAWIDINRILLDYTKEVKELRHKKIDLIEFLKENLEVFQLILGEKIKLYLDFGYYKSLVTYGDSAFWRYIFLNFLANAKDAMSGEGEIYLSVNKYKDPVNQKNYVKVSIRDTGYGIPEELISKIFEPFFTTKEKGSGLGLFLVNHHIKILGGFIEVESKLGSGTTFHLYLPLITESTFISTKKEITLEGKIVYVIEDEEDIRETIKEVLEDKGANVFSFSGGREVLEKIDELEKPDLILVDLNLPDLDGRDLIIKIKDKVPSLKILYLTGDIFVLSELPEEKVLLKPFKLEELMQKISSLLENG